MSAQPTLRLVRNETDGQIPPCDLEAELAVCGACLIDPKAIEKVASFLRPDHFYSEQYRRVYEACLGVRDHGKEIDVVLVASWLRDRQRLEQVGGMAGLTDIVSSVAAIGNIQDYARTVLNKWRVRQVIATSQRVAAAGYFDYGDPEEYIREAIRSIADIERQGLGARPESHQHALRALVKEIYERANGGATTPSKVTGIRTGVPSYDRMTNGLHSGEKTTIVALPGRGKSSLAMQIALSVASQGIGVVIFSEEMDRKELLLRMLSSTAKIDGKRLAKSDLRGDEWSRMWESAAVLEKLPIVIDDTKGMHIGMIRAATLASVDQLRVEFGAPLGLVVVDYIQRLSPAPEVANKKEHEQIYHSALEFKRLCQEMKIPGIEVAQQATNEIDKFTKKRPRPETGSTKGCRRLGDEANNLIFLHRCPAVDGAGKITGEDPNLLTLIVEKQRSGPTGDILLRFDRQWSRFEDLSSANEEDV